MLLNAVHKDDRTARVGPGFGSGVLIKEHKVSLICMYLSRIRGWRDQSSMHASNSSRLWDSVHLDRNHVMTPLDLLNLWKRTLCSLPSEGKFGKARRAVGNAKEGKLSASSLKLRMRYVLAVLVGRRNV